MNVRRIDDRVHGEVHLPPLAAQIVATPQFHRLDGIRQLGGCAFVYPWPRTRGANTRSACATAEKARRVQGNGPILWTTRRAVRRDRRARPTWRALLPLETYVSSAGEPWSHEEMALTLLDDIVPLVEWGSHFTDPDASLAFVRLLVRGIRDDEPWPEGEVRRPEGKRVLTSIVHNEPSGIDVDKLDYLIRDSLAVFGTTRAISVDRLINAARVVSHGGRWTLAYDECVAFDVAEIYMLRAKLHRQVYQHRAVVVVEDMIATLMRAVDACAPPGMRLADAIHSPARFATLTDADVLHRAYTTDPQLAPALSAWEALFRRPWLTRVPVTACLRTRPSCAHCATPTDVADAFCRRCGQSTESRAAVMCDGVRVPPECAITSDEATQDLCALLRRDDVRVYVVDVYVGARGVVHDAHGHAWRDFDPLRHVVFCSRDGQAIRMRPSPYYMPAVRHVRTAHCYLPAGAAAEEVAEAARAFADGPRASAGNEAARAA